MNSLYIALDKKYFDHKFVDSITNNTIGTKTNNIIVLIACLQNSKDANTSHNWLKYDDSLI